MTINNRNNKHKINNVELTLLSKVIYAKRHESEFMFNIDHSLPLLGFTLPSVRPNLEQVMRGLKGRIKKNENMTHEDIVSAHSTVKYLCEKMELDLLEGSILTLIVYLSQKDEWSELSKTRLNPFYKQVSQALNVKSKDVARALSPSRRLIRSGLVRRNYNHFRECPYEVITTLTEDTIHDYSEWQSQQRSLFTERDKPHLSSSDFTYVKDLPAIRSLLVNVIKTKTKGIHILIHGKPGLGKTTIADVLAKSVKGKLLEIDVSTQSEKGEETYERLQTYIYGQNILTADNRSIFLFDEMEDVFPRDSRSFNASNHKGFTNNLLENTALPTIWTTNHISHIDPAILRRFTVILEMPVMPSNDKKSFINRSLQPKGLSMNFLNELATNKTVTPALINKVTMMSNLLDVDNKEESITSLISQEMKALGGKLSPNLKKRETTLFQYKTDYLNTNVDIDSLLSGLESSGFGRLCLYGPSGTGKTQFAKHLAEQLGKKLIIKRPSDILGPFLGETEHKIAEMFSSANPHESIILMDEADGLFRSRKDATRSWEVNMVNELLGQMEDYEGIFIASTNLMENFDFASFRRFDYKIKFDYLSSEQSYSLFLDILKNQNISMPSSIDYRLFFNNIDNITIGTFNSAMRKIRLIGKEISAELLITTLKEEQGLFNTSYNKSIGFTAHVA